MSHLDIARAVHSQYEINEKNEKSPQPGADQVAPPASGYEINERNEISLPRFEELVWVHVSREEVEASRPPADWDGVVPDGCRWPGLCQTLGPCPHHLSHASCRIRERVGS